MSDSYEFVDGQKYAYPIVKMCEWLEVSRSGFYEWRVRPASATVERREKLKVDIARIFEENDATYGYRRIHAELARQGIEAGPELVRSLMREMGLVACQPRPRRHHLTRQDVAAGRLVDLLERDFSAEVPGEKLVGDITYIDTWEGWQFLLVTWNHMLVVQRRTGQSSQRLWGASEETAVGPRGAGEVACRGPVRARGRMAADVGGLGTGATHHRRLCTGAWRVPAAV